MKRSILALALAGTLLPVVATAQSAGQNPAGTMGSNRLGPAAYNRQIEQDRAERQRRDQARLNTPARRERAARLSAMASAGQCDQAIVVARQEHDDEMAQRLTEACAAAATPAAAHP